MPNIITSITLQKKNRNRFNIFLNDQYAFALNRQHAETLKQGDVLSDKTIAGLKLSDEKDTAHARALYYLNFRPRSRMEIKRYLTEKEFSLPAITNALSRLDNAGYINDREFANCWIENRIRLKPKGCYALTGELRAKGIDEQIIKDVLADFDESESAWSATTPRLKRLEKHEKTEFTKKLYNFLSRRGFCYDTCKEICDQAWQQINSQKPHD